MKILLWEIKREPYRCAKVSWLLYKLLGIKRKYPCGRGKTENYLCCCQPLILKTSNVINEGERHEVICKVCGAIRISSNKYINTNDDNDWWSV